MPPLGVACKPLSGMGGATSGDVTLGTRQQKQLQTTRWKSLRQPSRRSEMGLLSTVSLSRPG